MLEKSKDADVFSAASKAVFLWKVLLLPPVDDEPDKAHALATLMKADIFLKYALIRTVLRGSAQN